MWRGLFNRASIACRDISLELLEPLQIYFLESGVADFWYLEATEYVAPNQFALQKKQTNLNIFRKDNKGPLKQGNESLISGEI